MFSLWESALNWLRSLFFKQEMELTLVGLQNSGKTTLVNVIATGGFSEDMIPTVGFNMRKVTKGKVQLSAASACLLSAQVHQQRPPGVGDHQALGPRRPASL